MMVVPELTPITVPVPSTVATAVLLLLQVPPATVSVRVVLTPGHMVVPPVITLVDGVAIIVTAMVTLVAPQLLVTE